MVDAKNQSASWNPRLDEVIAAYLEAVAAGKTPDREELLARHPDLASELTAFFAEHDRIQHVVGPLKAAVETTFPASAVRAESATLPPAANAAESPTLAPSEPPALPLGTKVRYFGD